MHRSRARSFDTCIRARVLREREEEERHRMCARKYGRVYGNDNNARWEIRGIKDSVALA